MNARHKVQPGHTVPAVGIHTVAAEGRHHMAAEPGPTGSFQEWQQVPPGLVRLPYSRGDERKREVGGGKARQYLSRGPGGLLFDFAVDVQEFLQIQRAYRRQRALT